MTDHALPVTPEVGDEVLVRYNSRRSADHANQERRGTVARVAEYRGPDGRVGHVLLVREDASTYLAATVTPSGKGRRVYSVNYEDDDGDALQIADFYADENGNWHLSWTDAEKTRRVTLGRLVEVRLAAVGP